ncbi:hypothetical protein E4U41_004799, partial [Claviceps citrina]
SGHTFAVPWLPSVAHSRRRYYRYRLRRLFEPVVRARIEEPAAPGSDALQILLDSGVSADYIVVFLISILFISIANAGKVLGILLNLFCQHPAWQDRVLAEIAAAVAADKANKNNDNDKHAAASLLDRLDGLPLHLWESSFPFVDQLLREAIRMHVSFPMTRLNDSPQPIPIPGTGQVIPSQSFVAYNTNDAHLNEDMYPNPLQFDPHRFDPAREAARTESYGFLGWGNGRHRCVGQRWAKLQLTINMVYAVAMYRWSSCDADGNVLPPVNHAIDLDRHGNNLAKGIFAKFEPRG